MDLLTLISQLAATDPRVGASVAMENTESAVLAGMVSGDSATANLLGALSSEESEQAQLLNSAQPNLGQQINTLA